MARFTEEQQTAIELEGSSVVLSAGAGCGKTTVLTERLVRSLSPDLGFSLERIVVLTFTDKAAAELRARVRTAARAKLAEGEDVEYWRGVQRGLEAAPIGTFHTQFGNLLRRHAVWAGVDPEFTILDEVISKTMREQSVEACLRECLSEVDEDLRELAVVFGLDRVRDALVSLLEQRLAGSLANWAERTPEEVVDLWRDVFERDVKGLVFDEFREKLTPTLTLMRAHAYEFNKVMRERRDMLIDLIENRLPASQSIDVIKEIAEAARVQGAGTEKNWPDPALYKEVQATFKTLREKTIKSALESLDFDAAASLASATAGIRFARLGSRALKHYRANKTERGALDFDDLLSRTLELVLARPELSQSFDMILVDEFQDTDPTQDQIIRSLAGEDFDQGKLFIVGDFKQSIYGFRGAVPELFDQYRHEFDPEACLPLSTNFRSRTGVIEFVNAVFDDAFAHDYQPLRAGRGDELSAGIAPVVFSWPDASDMELVRSRVHVDELRGAEARRIARMIRQWIDEKRQIFDPAAKVVRAMHGGDVAILFRTQDNFPAYENALAREGIEFHVIGGMAFYAQAEVQDLINVLSVIDDPYDSLALAGALRGPFFRLSDEALFWLASIERGNLATGLANCDEDSLPGLSERDRLRAKRAHAQLELWRGLKDREPIAHIVKRMVQDSGFEAALMGEFLGDRKRANVRKLIKIARKYDEYPGFTLADFVARLKADRDRPPREETAGTTDEQGESVRLMTIHKAKGLEFPVVFLPDLGRRQGGRSDLVTFDSELGPVVKAEGEAEDDDGETGSGVSLGVLINKARRNHRERAESLRVFYVATTRARDTLVLSTSGDPLAETESVGLKLLQERFDLVSGRCLAAAADAQVQTVVEVFNSTQSPTRPRRNRPIPLRGIARLIETTNAAEHEPAVSVPQNPPHFQNLDPSRSLAPARAQLARLVHDLLIEPDISDVFELRDVASRLARRQMPMVGERTIAAAVERVLACWHGPLGGALRAAREVRRHISWTIHHQSTVFEGRIDLTYRAADDAWMLVLISDVASDVRQEHVRARLAQEVAGDFGLDPVAGVWLFRHGEGGSFERVL